MKKYKSVFSLLVFVFLIYSCSEQTTKYGDPLLSWNDGATKTAILDYVNDVTNAESENFIKISERIATFDNDGNLWSEQPAYFQLFFAIDRVKALASEHPEWKTEQPFKAVLDDDMNELMKHGEHGLIKLVMATHAGNRVQSVAADGFVQPNREPIGCQMTGVAVAVQHGLAVKIVQIAPVLPVGLAEV